MVRETTLLPDNKEIDKRITICYNIIVQLNIAVSGAELLLSSEEGIR